MKISDHPDIRERERNGVPAADVCVCPICGEECETIYKDKWGNVLGCEECVEVCDAWEVLDE